MFKYCLPPAGNNISLDVSDNYRNIKWPYKAIYYASGAMSLAASLVAAAQSKKSITTPEVIIPAYSCPELVSAVLHVGAKPILVDLAFNKPWIDIEELENKINKNTIAIIAVSLFGIPERLHQLRQLCDLNNIYLIEDNAQTFPSFSDVQFWKGDFIVLSFGRGKPVSSLGGGIVLCKNEALFQYLPFSGKITDFEDASLQRKMQFNIKIYIYNLLLNPLLYCIPANIAFLHLGETVFHPLDGIKRISEVNFRIIQSNISRYLTRSVFVVQNRLHELERYNLWNDLPAICGVDIHKTKLLRYPVLLHDQEQRDNVYFLLKEHGLGVSRMYRKPLNHISGLTDLLSTQGEFPKSQLFAESIITLPTHEGVTIEYLDKMEQVLKHI